ncbi:nitronate monooxygenase [Gluconacetobacter azotocaptans]|uniref:NAD(P)H-dependent flavin oxidoreductase n=1 Tax=Gluconacetobacter azotocaptans TaxID=142834 RepID=UPI00195C2014|nr:nitronate monooxygenase [Gluconacetobacter azotocaptans]MBM9400787.1 nitronate monooxygenase [Gluconacetobacter azotocaptans]
MDCRAKVRVNTKITQNFGLSAPIVLAPMGGVSGARLARAVAEAGGLGLLGGSYGDPTWIERELPAMAETRGVWGIGLVIFTIEKNLPLFDRVLEFKPPVVALSFGDPLQLTKRAHAAGSKVLMQVHEVDQAVSALRAGVDVLIVQGAEAGGHGLRRATMPLVPAVRDAVGDAIPIVAAGGIADGRGLAAALALGADGVMMGTRFVATREALPSQIIKEAIVAARAGDTVRTRVFDVVRGIDWPKGYCGRAIANNFSAEWMDRDDQLQKCAREVRADFQAASDSDNLAIKAVWCGEVADLVKTVKPAGDVVDETVKEAEAEIRKLSFHMT